MSDYLPLYLPGKAIPMTASADVVGGTVARVSGSNTVAAATQASHIGIGVFAHDAKAGERVTVFGRGTVHRLKAAGAVTAADIVEAAAAGAVATHTQGANDVRTLGIALTTAADAALVEIMEL